MDRARVVWVVFVCSFFAACSGNGLVERVTPQRAVTETPLPSPSPTASPSPSATPARPPQALDARLAKEIKEIAEEAQGKLGVAAVMLETGQTVEVDAGAKYPSQSVYKLPIAMAVLKLVDDGRVALDQQVLVRPEDFVRWGFHSPIRNMYPQGTVLPVSELLRASIAESDGTASDVLLDLAGGPAAVQAYLNGLGITDFIVADSTKSISKDWETQYRNWATPRASVELLRLLYERRALRDASTSLLLQYMNSEEKTGPERLKKGLPDGARLAHKTGTGGTKNRITGATNDIGIITLPDGRHIAIAVYIMDSSAPAATRNDVTGKIAKAVIEKWAPGLYSEEDPADKAESK